MESIITILFIVRLVMSVIGWFLMPPDMVYLNLSGLCLPGELMNESISEIGTPLMWIQLSSDGRMIMRIMGSTA